MKILTPGVRYVLANVEHPNNGQTVQFLDRQVEKPSVLSRKPSTPKFVTMNDGTTAEEVLKMLGDHLTAFYGRNPNVDVLLAVHHCDIALNCLNKRTEELKG